MKVLKANISDEIEKEKCSSPKFKKAWDESREEYRLIGEMIKLRKQEKITQSRLSELTGNKQQVISRIEKKRIVHLCGYFVICSMHWGMN